MAAISWSIGGLWPWRQTSQVESATLLMKVQSPQAHDVGLFASSSSFRFSSFSLSSSARRFASSAPGSSSLSVSDSTNYTYSLYIALST